MGLPVVGQGAFLAAGEQHVRDRSLAEGDFVRFEVEQLGVDLALKLRSPSGDVLATADSPTGPRGPEELVAISVESGIHRLEVVDIGGDDSGGHYRVVALESRRAGETERHWVSLIEAYETLRRQRLQREFAAAAQGFEAQIPQWKALGLRRWAAYAAEELCWARQGLGEIAGAVQAAEEAIVWYRQLGLQRRLGNMLQTVATLHLRLGAIDLSRRRLEEAEPVFRSEQHWRGLIRNLGAQGGVASLLGDPSRARELLRRALQLADDRDEIGLEGVLRNDLGAVLLSEGRTKSALKEFESAAEIHRRTGFVDELSVALNGLARSAQRLGRTIEAIAAVDEGLSSLGTQGEARSRAILLLTKGGLQRLSGNVEAALATFRQGQEAARQGELPLVEADLLLAEGHALGLLGESLSGLGRVELALRRFEDAGMLTGIASSRARGAELLGRLGQLEEAWDWLEPALDLVDGLRRSADRRDHRLAYFAFRQDYFAMARDLLLDLGRRDGDAARIDQALEVEERRRAQELLIGLGEDSDDAVSIGEVVEAERDELEAELRTLALSTPNDGVEARVEEIVEALHRLHGRSEAQRRADAARSPSKTFDLAEARRRLDSETTVLVFSLGVERSLLWTLDAEGLEVRDLTSRQVLERAAKAFSRAVASPDPADQALVATLGEDLVQRLFPEGPARPLRRRLALIGEGDLLSVPIAVLPRPDGDGWILSAHEVVALPSLSAWAALRRRGLSRAEQGHRVVLADPVFEVDDPRITGREAVADDRTESEIVSRSMEDLGIPAFERLRASGWEAEAIDSLLPDAEIYRGFAVSRHNFKTLGRRPLALLHVATHALLHPRPELSGLMFSRFDADGRPQDGFLPAIELAGLSLNADLVVLSACSTGVGREIPGEGPLTLAWAFLDGGADRVVASLWKVSDVSTAELMRFFYEQLERGVPPAAALRTAQLEMSSKRNAQPYDWAGFVLHGDW